MTTITTLDPTETNAALGNARYGTEESQTAQIARALIEVANTDASVFVTGLTEASMNTLRTRMYRKNMKITARKIERDGETGHILLARSVTAV